MATPPPASAPHHIYQRYRNIVGERGPFKHVCDLALPYTWDTEDE